MKKTCLRLLAVTVVLSPSQLVTKIKYLVKIKWGRTDWHWHTDEVNCRSKS